MRRHSNPSYQRLGGKNICKVNKRNFKWAKTPHQRRYIAGKLSTWKDAPHHVTKELQLKATMSYHYTPIRMLKSKIQQQMLVRMWTNTNSHSLLVRIQNGTAN